MSLVVYHPEFPDRLFADRRGTHSIGFASHFHKLFRATHGPVVVGVVGDLDACAWLQRWANGKRTVLQHFVTMLRRLEREGEEEGVPAGGELLLLTENPDVGGVRLINVSSKGLIDLPTDVPHCLGDASPAGYALVAAGMKPGAKFFKAVAAAYPSVSPEYEEVSL